MCSRSLLHNHGPFSEDDAMAAVSAVKVIEEVAKMATLTELNNPVQEAPQYLQISTTCVQSIWSKCLLRTVCGNH